jgi:hypothetical protein
MDHRLIDRYKPISVDRRLGGPDRLIPIQSVLDGLTVR